MARPPVFARPRRLSGSAFAGLNIGILGGSFNPAHAGHRHISIQALNRLRLDCIWWLVSPQNPLKTSRGMASLARRLARAQAVANHPRIVATALESEIGTQFTADTLREICLRFPRTKFIWLMGADNLAQIGRWDRWTQIFHQLPVAVFDRPTYAHKALGSVAAGRFARFQVAGGREAELRFAKPPRWSFLRIPLSRLSATAIRAGRDGDW